MLFETCLQVMQWGLLCAMAVHAALDCVCTVCCLFHLKSELFATLYVSVFRDAINSEHAALQRVMVYWASAMSLTRVMALCFRIPELYCTVAVMYLLEALVAEYEGFSAGTIQRRTARSISILSFNISGGILVFLCIIPSVLPSVFIK
jgi:hypothetical protein